MILFGLVAFLCFQYFSGGSVSRAEARGSTSLKIATFSSVSTCFRVLIGVFKRLFSTYIQDSSFGELTCQMQIAGSAEFCDICKIIWAEGLDRNCGFPEAGSDAHS